MSLPRTFVGFSSTDIASYRLMLAWKAHEHIDFDFTDCQLQDALNSTDEQYIKRRCRERLDMAGTYILLIGPDTRYKTTYVKWEAEVAIEKGCRTIGVNLDKWWKRNPSTCPNVLTGIGAMFVPFSPPIVAEALRSQWQQGKLINWHFDEPTYQRLGYALLGDVAMMPPKPNPYARKTILGG